MTSFGRYALIGRPTYRATPPAACKRLRLAVFVPRIAACLDYSVRVYFVEDTTSALEVPRRVSNVLYHNAKFRTSNIRVLFHQVSGPSLL